MSGDAERAVRTLYGQHYRSLVCIAALLVGDISAAERLVQDAFVSMHASWLWLADTDRALSYLHQSLIRRSRSVSRQRRAAAGVADGHCTAGRAGATASATPPVSALMAALRALSPRQREALVLLYCAGLPEAEAASAMGIGRGAVRSHADRAISALAGDIPSAF